nr:hypothetical protein CFP56_35207 [Quercus suber]
MNVLAWNCRGLGSTPVVRILTDEVKSKRSILVFLMEMKASSSKVKEIQNKLELTQGISVPSDGPSRGLEMLWKEGHAVVESYGFLRTPRCKQKAHLMEAIGNIEGAM